MATTAHIGAEEFGRIVGSEHVRAATPEDAIDGVQPALVAAPGDVEELSATLKLAGAQGMGVAPRGAGTHLSLGAPPERLDVIVSTHRLDRVLEYNPGDLVVKAEAGVPLHALQTALGASGQMLALDQPDDRATLGGIIATDASGPLRLRYGTMRDLLIGITVVLADGTVARAGGKVVKNVAGYDLAKLFTGSLGTLGV
nr:FAD-binding oxidoreductase [Chloroflexota bacterium]